ncbi:MAG: YifB family Mg chelatase-like AAA ATPase [Clostridium sp.]|jgi:magnesium chelatase family protein|uniref:YifB family Mg chelatase-like AAA ATPase n=1 Tax=Clostridium sp. TaxID=1506 RepID=UPI0025BC64D8|nr:YifB family Mg chelatase-like AAA ATPase [Clostridium sp.]MCH3964000.1 YifB family Mg chelatase-like AAA ATPase [Clostridium sp.]MCI1716201.1 YifB family Mg chelatase-like AAA ATPase [Clostridium sp.]MCI1800559.1 YifB family Mg chelatase-like AAA ATPase [Clostridium sp.]MCI1814378.1 YifB family Mg chelatase-like AAA ATPase [Clostridium sp.]MCI1871277.1 YifB family Mg chelatase-like AAA ATPase [Clostridium sp.]
MAVKITTAFLVGIAGNIISVEINIENGFPCFNIVGLADTSVRESRDRVRASIINSGFKFPIKKITVNLAPADIKKFGSLFDLPIALGILYATAQIDFKDSENFIVLGELSLFGNLNRVTGVLPITIEGVRNNIKNFIVPLGNSEECSVVKGANCYAFKNLKEVVQFIKYRNTCPYVNKSHRKSTTSKLDFSDVLGQESCKRAIEVAAAGHHNILMIGPAGSGKTMLAMRIPSILPDLNYEDALDVTRIYSAAGMLDKDKSLILEPPFRNPHHTTTSIALIGGGSKLMPGEISLAHNGILFLDEILEFKRNVLEVLRQPMEENIITISRSNGKVNYPCNFMTVMATNPCKCGNFGSNRHCSCTEYERNRYISKLSAPILDRIDIFIFVNTPSFIDLKVPYENRSSKDMKKNVIYSRKLQMKRLKDENIQYNSQMNGKLIKKYCAVDDNSNKLFSKIFSKYNLSARAYNKILKVSRTIADLDNKELIETSHIIEALNYRKFMNNKIV